MIDANWNVSGLHASRLGSRWRRAAILVVPPVHHGLPRSWRSPPVPELLVVHSVRNDVTSGSRWARVTRTSRSNRPCGFPRRACSAGSAAPRATGDGRGTRRNRDPRCGFLRQSLVGSSVERHAQSSLPDESGMTGATQSALLGSRHGTTADRWPGIHRASPRAQVGFTVCPIHRGPHGQPPFDDR